jgi:glycosyltransferase involved in cell wall biosynthesis
MNICFISKYPPIEGFVSSYTYWLVRALGEKGHKVHVVTNAQEVDPQYREVIDAKDKNYCPDGVALYTTAYDKGLGCIPLFNPYTEKLASIALDIVRDADIDVVDSWYLVPYGVAALLVTQVSKHPLIGRVAGSDAERMCYSPQFRTLASVFFKNCKKIVGTTAFASGFDQYSSKIIPHSIVLNTDYFNCDVTPFDLTFFPSYSKDTPVITYIGKAGSHKGFYPLAKVLSKIDEPFLFLVVSNGGELQKFKTCITSLSMDKKTLFLPFQPPWKMPSIYRASTGVVSLEYGGLIGRSPFIPREAAACGCCTVMSPEIHSKWYYRMLENGKHTIVADPENPDELFRAVHELINHPEKASVMGMEAHNFFSKLDNPHNYQRYIDKTVELYTEVCEKS